MEKKALRDSCLSSSSIEASPGSIIISLSFLNKSGIRFANIFVASQLANDPYRIFNRNGWAEHARNYYSLIVSWSSGR